MSAPRFLLAAGVALVPQVFGGIAQAEELRRVFELRDKALSNVVVAAYEAEGRMADKAARRGLSLLARRFRAQHRAAAVHLFLYPRGAAPLSLPPEALTGSYRAAEWFRQDPESVGWLWGLRYDGATGEERFISCNTQQGGCHVLQR